MTKDRFKAIGVMIWQGNDVWCVAGGKHCADVIATALNEQQGIIDDLQSDIGKVLFALGFATFDDAKLGKTEVDAIERLQNYLGESILDMEKLKEHLK